MQFLKFQLRSHSTESVEWQADLANVQHTRCVCLFAALSLNQQNLTNVRHYNCVVCFLTLRLCCVFPDTTPSRSRSHTYSVYFPLSHAMSTSLLLVMCHFTAVLEWVEVDIPARSTFSLIVICVMCIFPPAHAMSTSPRCLASGRARSHESAPIRRASQHYHRNCHHRGAARGRSPHVSCGRALPRRHAVIARVAGAARCIGGTTLAG